MHIIYARSQDALGLDAVATHWAFRALGPRLHERQLLACDDDLTTRQV